SIGGGGAGRLQIRHLSADGERTGDGTRSASVLPQVEQAGVGRVQFAPVQRVLDGRDACVRRPHAKGASDGAVRRQRLLPRTAHAEPVQGADPRPAGRALRPAPARRGLHVLRTGDRVRARAARAAQGGRCARNQGPRRRHSPQRFRACSPRRCLAVLKDLHLGRRRGQDVTQAVSIDDLVGIKANAKVTLLCIIIRPQD
ncbi:unnamed protein product, partial [Ixodes pacificus]